METKRIRKLVENCPHRASFVLAWKPRGSEKFWRIVQIENPVYWHEKQRDQKNGGR